MAVGYTLVMSELAFSAQPVTPLGVGLELLVHYTRLFLLL